MPRLRKGNRRHANLTRGRSKHLRWLRWWHERDRVIQWALGELKKGRFVEDCRAHPCRVTKVTDEGTDLSIEVVSLVSGTPNSCSLNHCGLDFLTEEEANDRAQFTKLYGQWVYQMKYVYPDVPKEQREQGLRELQEMEKVWGFAKNGKVDTITDKGKDYVLETYGVDVDSVLAA